MQEKLYFLVSLNLYEHELMKMKKSLLMYNYSIEYGEENVTRSISESQIGEYDRKLVHCLPEDNSMYEIDFLWKLVHQVTL